MSLQIALQHRAEPTVADLVRIEGSAASPWAAALACDGSQRDLADAAHALCTMYGAHPGLIDSVAERDDGAMLNAWMLAAAVAFTQERSHLAAVIASAGPLPSTPGQAQTEAAIAAQRHALDMLAHSDRAGCAVGAAVALALDWHRARPVIAAVGERAGIVLPACTLPIEPPSLSGDPAIERARIFGARQLLTQQRGLWALLEARSIARNTG